MATHDDHHEPVVDQEALDKAVRMGYEHRDVDTVAVGKFGLWFTIFTFFCIGATVVAWVIVDRVVYDTPVSARTEPDPRRTLPPGPLLQSNITAKKDIADLRRDEDRKANYYGWVDQQKGIVRVPVDVALDRVAVKGLPSVPQQVPPPKPADMGQTEVAAR